VCDDEAGFRNPNTGYRGPWPHAVLDDELTEASRKSREEIREFRKVVTNSGAAELRRSRYHAAYLLPLNDQKSAGIQNFSVKSTAVSSCSGVAFFVKRVKRRHRSNASCVAVDNFPLRPSVDRFTHTCGSCLLFAVQQFKPSPCPVPGCSGFPDIFLCRISSVRYSAMPTIERRFRDCTTSAKWASDYRKWETGSFFSGDPMDL